LGEKRFLTLPQIVDITDNRDQISFSSLTQYVFKGGVLNQAVRVKNDPAYSSGSSAREKKVL
jgi:hypothetical protein